MTAARKGRAPAGLSEPAGRCTWLAGDLLLISRLPAAGDWEAVARVGRKANPIESAGVTFTKAGEPPSGIVVLRLAERDRRDPPDSISLKADLKGDATEVKLDRAALAKQEISLEELISGDLAGGDAVSRAALREALDRVALPGLERPGRVMLATRLRDLREALRDHLPQLISGPQTSQAASIDLVMAIDDRSFWIVGWIRDADETLARLSLIAPEGSCAALPPDAFRFSRPDVQEVYGDPPEQRHGFIAYLRLARPSILPSGWLAVIERSDGSACELQAPEVIRDLDAARVRILDEFGKTWPDREQLRTKHAMPALARLQERHASLVGVESVEQHGTPPDTPGASIVIPLYGRIDLVEHQLAHFGQDPELAQADIVYVLDSPELAPALDSVAADLYALYGIPFRVVKLTRNGGYSAANNIGAAQARADLLLLLNSDVIPIQPGWLGRMAAFYDSTPNIGTLGPKLLFEDLSIQHAGMYFERELHTSLWGNLHYYKGFHRDFAPASVSRPVPAVTGACMMLGRGLYQEIGGFRYGFVKGGYEDSDLCLRLAERGLRNWYLAEVELYHLEAQSFPSPERQLATGFNTWLQTYLWDQPIEQIMQEQKHAEPVPTGAADLPSRLSSVG